VVRGTRTTFNKFLLNEVVYLVLELQTVMINNYILDSSKVIMTAAPQPYNIHMTISTTAIHYTPYL